MSHLISKHKLSKKIKKEIILESKRLGFDAIGFTKPNFKNEVKRNLDDFFNNNYHGEMDWLKRNKTRRESPKNIWSNVKTIISLGINYGPDDDPLKLIKEKDLGNISVYARGEDYHKIIKKNLKIFGSWIVNKLNCEIKIFVDTAPVLEKNIAELAGLGWQGKHTNLVSKDFGSWLFLAEIFVDRNIEIDLPQEDNCGTCNKCQDICPTEAFTKEYKLDARKCISYLTIEHKSQIPIQYRKKIGNRIYGCDDCLAICPWNKFAKKSKEIRFTTKEKISDFSLSKLSKLEDKTFREFFSGSPIKRIGRDRFLRNVMIAIGNSGKRSLSKETIMKISDKSPLVRGAAIWATRNLLDDAEIKDIKEKSLNKERDNSVKKEWH